MKESKEMLPSLQNCPLCAALFLVILVGGVHELGAQPPDPKTEDQSHNMRLVGYHDLQARPAYQPVILQQGDRWIAYIGMLGGQEVNPISGQLEWNGTLIVDVTNPQEPSSLSHVPGGQAPPSRAGSGAQMNQVCARNGRTYLLRSFGGSRHEVWEVTAPSQPRFVSTIIDGLTSIHKNWWECDSGIAYIVSGDPDWRSRSTKIFDLSNPQTPVFIRDFGLVGQEPGSQIEPVPIDLHGPIALGERVYFGYGSSRGGVVQIVDRAKLLQGDPEPTLENLLFPQLGRFDLAPTYGGHTTFPVLGVSVPDYQDNLRGRVRDLLVVPSESTQNECREYRHAVFFIDITDPRRPTPIASYQVPESEGEYCQKGGRFGPHATNESMSPIYYRRIVFVSYFNAGVRALDIRDPFHPREIAFFIPGTNANSAPSCVKVEGEEARCKVAIQTNNVEVDDRGFIYIVDRVKTGMHILELTGPARSVANFP